MLNFTSEEMRVYLGKDTVINILMPLYRNDGADDQLMKQFSSKTNDIQSIVLAGFRLMDDEDQMEK